MTYPQKATFVSIEYLLKMTTINDQVDENIIWPCMYMAQDKWLAPYLGDALYAKLAADIPNPAGVYLTLMRDYVIDVVVWGTMLELLPKMQYRYNNGTLSQHNSEDSTPVDDSIMKDELARTEHNLKFYTERLVNYLCNTSSSYPEYSSNTGSQRSPIRLSVSSSYVFSDGRSATRSGVVIHNRYLPI